MSENESCIFQTGREQNAPAPPSRTGDCQIETLMDTLDELIKRKMTALKVRLHWRCFFLQRYCRQQQHANHYLPALATLGDATQIGSFLFLSCRPRWPRQVQVCCCHMSLSLALSCHLRQCKHCLRVATEK
jgi:hypothetical protein